MDIKLMPEKYKKKGIGSDLKKSPSVSNGKFLFTLSSTLLIIVVLACFGLWGYKISLNKGMEDLVQRFEELKSQRNLELENSFAELKEKIDSFKSILAKRVYFLNALKMIEELTLIQVHYIDFRANLSEAAISLGIQTTSYNILVKQIAIFESDARIKEVNFSKVGLEKSGWVGSTLNLKLNPSFLYE